MINKENYDEYIESLLNIPWGIYTEDETDLNKIITDVLSGQLALFVDGNDSVVLIDIILYRIQWDYVYILNMASS